MVIFNDFFIFELWPAIDFKIEKLGATESVTR